MSDAAWALRTAREVGPIPPPHAHAHPIHKLHTGPLHSTVAGRTDHLPSQVPNGSFVLPADIVSGLGEGNTMSGFKAAKRMFEGAHREFGGTPYAGSNGPYGQGTGLPYAIGHAKGGVIGRNEKQTLIGPGTEEWQSQPCGGVMDSNNAVTGPTMPEGDQSFQEQLQNNRNRQDIIDQHIGTEMAKGGQVDSQTDSPYTFSNDVTGASRGETYGLILAKHVPSNSYVGQIQYGASPQQTRIHDIKVNPDHQHNGVASSMMDHLKSEFPHNKVNWGMTTPDGEAFKRAYYQRADGGQTSGDQAVPVAVAGGEHVLAPHEVAFAGMGDMEAGHKALEAFVLRQRAKLIKTLKGLPGPKRD